MRLLRNLRRELWHNCILSLLSLQDMCRLDSAVLNRLVRSNLLSLLVNIELAGESIVDTEIID